MCLKEEQERTTHPLLTQQKQPYNQLPPNQSTKPTNMGGPFSIDNLVSYQSKSINKILSFCTSNTSSRHTILFLAFYTTQTGTEESPATPSYFCQQKHLSSSKATPAPNLASPTESQGWKTTIPDIGERGGP